MKRGEAMTTQTASITAVERARRLKSVEAAEHQGDLESMPISDAARVEGMKYANGESTLAQFLEGIRRTIAD